MLCDRATGTLYLVYTLTPVPNETRIHFVRSTDAGMSWSVPVALSGSPSNTAQLALGPDGELYVVWEDYSQGAIVGRKSENLGSSFGPEFVVGMTQDNIGLTPPNWQGSVSRHPLLPNVSCMDTPAFLGVAVDTSPGPRRGSLYAVWTEHELGTVAADPVRWVNEVEPNHGFANATPIEIGDNFSGVAISADEPPFTGDCDLFTFEGTAGTTIQITGAVTECLTQGGCSEPPFEIGLFCGNDSTSLTFVGCGPIYDPSPVPPLIYTLPTTGRYYIFGACSSSGSIYYTFRLREYVPAPSQAAQDHRDVVLVRSTDGGATWSEKVRVNDDPPMHDNSIPAVTVDRNGRVHVAWYDRRDEPECGRRVHTYWTWSDDGGATFAASRRISEQPSDAGGYDERRWRVGDHMALHADGERVHLLWTYIPIGGGDGEIHGVTITDLPTATAVSRFTAQMDGDRVALRWRVGDEREVAGFRIHRSDGEAEAFAPVASLEPGGRVEYGWDDRSVVAGRRYRYRLEVRRRQAASWWAGPVEVTVDARPAAKLQWREAVPNPFDQVVELALESGDPAATRVRVYDVTGKRVVELKPEVDGVELRVRWNGRNASGRAVAPGVYLVRAEAGGRIATRRVIRMR